MIIVSDTSLINYLVLIGEIEILQTLAGHVIIPQAVNHELQDPHTPQQVKDWLDFGFGKLEEAARKNLLDFPDAVGRLSRTSVYMPPDEIIQSALKRDQERKDRGCGRDHSLL